MTTDKLYRFLPLDEGGNQKVQLMHLNSMLVEGNYHFQTPKKFNDPFDCKPNLYINLNDTKAYNSFYRDFRNTYPKYGHVGATNKIRAFLENPELLKEGQRLLNDQLKENIESCGIMCLSASLYNILLWAHYANGHQGFCIAFYKDRLIEYAGTVVGRLKEVKYQKSYPFIKYFGNDSLPKILKTIYTKSVHWKYEEEWRFLIPSIENRIKKIPDDCLYAIYLDARINDKNKECILDIVKNRKKRLSVFQMNLSETRYAGWRKKIM